MSNTSKIFEPNEVQKLNMPNFVDNNVPRFLFRIHAPSSVGSTNRTFAQSPVSAGRYEEEESRDIFSLPLSTAADKLNKHLQWKCMGNRGCNLVSWTSSLLFALLYGLRRLDTDRDHPKASEINLFVIDTRNFQAGTFIKDLDIIRVLAHEEEDPRQYGSLSLFQNLRNGNHYFGEYLTQGKLKVEGQCVQTTLEELKNHGLLQLNAGIAETSMWSKPVRNILAIRDSFALFEEARTAEKTEVRKAIAMAESCFGGRWTFPMALHLLALKPRRNPDTVVADAFKAMFTMNEVESLSLHNIKINSRKLPEVAQFERLLDLVHYNFFGEHIGIRNTDNLANAIGNISL